MGLKTKRSLDRLMESKYRQKMSKFNGKRMSLYFFFWKDGKVLLLSLMSLKVIHLYLLNDANPSFPFFFYRKLIREDTQVPDTWVHVIWGWKYFLIKPLPWRSETFQKDIKILDQKYKDFIETDKGRNQKCPRELGGFSKRPKPIIPNGCEWACKN